ncbi:unnamed protein product [Paramecium sonneborni]|uniref:Uncharacterized protein n=1 Tax=Paramecium sonneborni TaxID=65129 RepID=A0A8S1QAC3_9CILI|nr:unnamed protein product [Paramecium sonneborni]
MSTSYYYYQKEDKLQWKQQIKLINCQQNQLQNFYNLIFEYNKQHRSTSKKVKRLGQLTQTSEIKQDYYKVCNQKKLIKML